MARLASLFFLVTLLGVSASHAQLASWSFDTDLTAAEGSQFDATVFGNYSFVAEGDRQYLRLPEADGVLILPQAAAELLDDGLDFEVRLDFRYEAPVNHSGLRQILVMRSAPCNNWIMRCYGTGVASGEDNGITNFTVNFADGLENQVPNHPASDFHDNLKNGGTGSVPTEWMSLRYVVSPFNGRWSMTVNGNTVSGHITEPGESYQYDVNAIMSHVLSNPILIGGESPSEAQWDARAMHVDNVAIYSPRFFAPTELSAAFSELTSHVDGQTTLSASRLGELFDLMGTDLPDPIDPIRSEAMGFLAAYEANRPPLFESDDRVRRTDMPFDDQIAYFIQDRIQASDFVNDRVADHAHIKFEAREAFPGVIDASEPRIGSAQVTWDGTYQLNPKIILTASEFVVRPSGYWAPAGELITVEMPQEAVDSGVSILVGAHYRIVTDDLETQNRFHDIGTEFPVDRTTMLVANPFGGGIYLKVPDGTTLGNLDVTISGAVKSAYYSHRDGAQSDVSEWVSTVSTTSVPWVDLEGDRFMTTMPVDIARRIDNPDEIMEKWDLLFSQHSELAGRTEPNGRAEYYLKDRQLVTPAFGAGYPVTIGSASMRASTTGDFSFDSQYGSWNPFRIVRFRPNEVLLHELGHNLLLPEFLYPDDISFTSESSVHIWGSKIYNTIYGLDGDEAFSVTSHQRMSMDLAAMDWMLTYNFRNDIPMGFDPTIDPSVNDQLRYQHRGHGPIVDFAWLFGWDALGEVYGKFYDGSFGPPDGARFTHVRTRDQLVQASSEVTGVNTSPFWYFWGWFPSNEVMSDLANRYPTSQQIRERIEHYRSLIPSDAAGYDVWHDQFALVPDDFQQARWESYRQDYGADFRDQVLAQFDRIFSLPVAAESTVLPAQLELSAAWPNPFTAQLTIPFTVPQPGTVDVEIFDMLGRRVAVLMDSPLPAGEHRVSWEPKSLGAGIYAIRLSTGGHVLTRMVSYRP